MQKILDRLTPPALKAIEKIIIPRAEKHILDNGIPLYVVNAGFQDLVKVDLIFGNLTYDPSQPLLSSATNRMLAEGTAIHSALEIADLIDYYGCFYSTEESPDFSSVNVYTLNKHLSKTLPTLREILTQAIFPDSDLATFVRNNKQRITVENEKVNAIARKKFNEILFGSDHPYGHISSIEDYNSIKRASLIDYHRRQYVSDHCTMIASGKVTDETISQINKHLGDKGWSRSNGQLASPVPVSGSTERIHRVEKDGAIQSAIRIGKKMFNRSHEDYPGMAVLNTIFGGYFGSRLMSNIREDKGYTYGIGSAVVAMKEQGYFFISTEVGSNVAEAALSEIYKEMQDLVTNPVDSEELETVRNYMLGSFIKNLETAFHISDRFKSIFMSGLDYDYYDRYLLKLRTIDSDEIQALAKKYLNPESMTELVVGPK
jgi:predicted Zn-dependent peptidase